MCLDSLGIPSGITIPGHSSLWRGFSKDDMRPFVSVVVLSDANRVAILNGLRSSSVVLWNVLVYLLLPDITTSSALNSYCRTWLLSSIGTGSMP